jgi:hypothetical protein
MRETVGSFRSRIKDWIKFPHDRKARNGCQRISLEEFKKFGARTLLTLSGFEDKTGTKEEGVGGFVRVVNLNDFGKTGEDVMWPDKVLRPFLEGKEVEGLYNYYDSYEALKAIILYYLNKKPPVLSVHRKKVETRILKGRYFPSK